MNSENRARFARAAGVVGMASAVLWLIALFLEYRYRLQPPGDGSLGYFADQVVFFVALAGYLVMLVGLWQARAAGRGAFGTVSLGIFIAALAALLVAQIVQWLTHNPDFVLFPVGGLLQLLGGLLTGIAVVTARRWDGWQRFAPLLQGLYYLIVLFVPLAMLNHSPTQLTESIWQVTWFITSLALFTGARSSQIRHSG
jgi:vacuolar-type H+-ATPase subunit I/STV1